MNPGFPGLSGLNIPIPDTLPEHIKLALDVSDLIQLVEEFEAMEASIAASEACPSQPRKKRREIKRGREEVHIPQLRKFHRPETLGFAMKTTKEYSGESVGSNTSLSYKKVKAVTSRSSDVPSQSSRSSFKNCKSGSCLPPEMEKAVCEAVCELLQHGMVTIVEVAFFQPYIYACTLRASTFLGKDMEERVAMIKDYREEEERKKRW